MLRHISGQVNLWLLSSTHLTEVNLADNSNDELQLFPTTD